RKAERNALLNNTNTVVIGHDLHAAGRTYLDKNTPAQISEDAANLNAAALKDQSVHLQNAAKYGYDEAELQRAFDQLNQRNQALFSRLSTAEGIKAFFNEFGIGEE